MDEPKKERASENNILSLFLGNHFLMYIIWYIFVFYLSADNFKGITGD